VEQVFDITEHQVDGRGIQVIKVAGEIDVATSPSLRERLQSAGGAAVPVQVVDLLDVTFLDSTGLGVLVGALKRRREAEGSLRLVISESRILRIFEITGLIDVFSIYPTVEEALEI
jgi:anti-sigma B factor antagonist